MEVEGSSYRQPGARLLVDAEGRVLAGAISGGCLEGDVAARAAGVIAAGTGTVLRYDLRNDLETIWGFGSACDGIATIVLEPLDPRGWLIPASELTRARLSDTIVTAYHQDGDTGTGGTVGLASTLAHEGSPGRALVEKGRALATRTGRPQLLVDEATERRALFDPVVPPVALHLVGAGRGAEAFARIAAALGWQVTAIDHRPALLDGLALPPGTTALLGGPELAASLPADGRTAVALLTHIFDTDLAWLEATIARPVGYVGILGSRARAALLVERLAERGVPLSPSQRALLHAPIGLDLGGESPESIALAAIAEIEATLNGRPGGSLRERQSPIHERTPVPRAADPAAGIAPACALTDIADLAAGER